MASSTDTATESLCGRLTYHCARLYQSICSSADSRPTNCTRCARFSRATHCCMAASWLPVLATTSCACGCQRVTAANTSSTRNGW